ncbi:hypothetical protein D3C75_377860 [compost metagenome]
MHLAGIGLIDCFALNEPFDHNKNIVEDRHAHRQNRDEQRQHRGLLKGSVQGDYRQDKAEKGSAGVAHEDFGGCLVKA